MTNAIFMECKNYWHVQSWILVLILLWIVRIELVD